MEPVLAGALFRLHAWQIFGIEGDGGSWAGSRWATFVRLNRNGDLAWIDQPAFCEDTAFLPPPALNGLYSIASQQLIAPSARAKLANQRLGRRAITDDGRALVFLNSEIAWLGASGLQPTVQTGGTFEAVSDASGDNVVYNETDGGALHWLSGGQDENLGFDGRAPALTDDGKLLVFLDGANLLRAYDRQSTITRQFSTDAMGAFTLGGNFAFAVNSAGQIVRFDLLTGMSILWLSPSPQIDSLDALLGAQLCAFTCYGPQEPGYKLSLGTTVTLTGKSLNRSGLVAIIGGVSVPIVPASDTTASFQVPMSAPVSHDGYYDTTSLMIRDSSSLVSFETKIVVVQ